MNININSSTFEDFIWMSYRYCIGRKTIASHQHADTIANIILHNPDILSDDRKEFMAGDIMMSILDNLRWNKHISISHISEDTMNNFDIFDELFYYSNTLEDPYSVKYIIDASSKKITHQEFITDPKLYDDKFDAMYSDLLPWVKLAKILNKSKHHKIYTKYISGNKEVKETITCYSYPIKHDNQYIKVWNSISDSVVTQTRYLNSDCIVDIS